PTGVGTRILIHRVLESQAKESAMSVSPAKIRRLFLEPKPSYSAPEAAVLLGMTSRELGGWVEAGELEGEQTKEGLALPWTELVSFAMGFWDQEEIEAALGDELAVAIPELLRLVDL